MSPIPLLILGDAPDLHNGLGRIGHDLAWLLSSMPEFHVGYLGREATGRAKFPWAQYSFRGGWGEHKIVEAWGDLSAGREGIIFTIWDATRLLWFTNPSEGMPEKLQKFLTSGRFKRWGYFMQDAEGPSPGMLPYETASVMARYDRVCLASKWAYDSTVRTVTNHPDIDWIPHGINRSIFKPVDRDYGRAILGVDAGATLIGCCMSNQDRKHWPTVIEAVSLIPNAVLWAHTDRVIHGWNLQALAFEYGVADRVVADIGERSDKEMAALYSACDATLVISGGEGFCYPVVESMSCGVPVVTGAYGAQSDFWHWKVAAKAFRIETPHNVRRAVYEAADVAQALRSAIDRGGGTEEERQVEHLDWPKLGKVWKKWARKGIACDSGNS